MKILLDYIKDCNSSEEVVQKLIEAGVITQKTVKSLAILDSFREKACQNRLSEACIDAAIGHGVSTETVYRKRKQFSALCDRE